MRVQNTAGTVASATPLYMTARSRILLLAFSALGVAASASSTFVHYRLLTDPTYASFCDISASVNCTQAYLSQYGSFLGVPVAPVGLLYFLFVLLMAGVAGSTTSPASETAPAYIFAVSTVALAFVLYLAWASYFVLENLLHPLRDHIRVGHRDFHHFRWSHQFSHDDTASARCQAISARSFPIRLRSCSRSCSWAARWRVLAVVPARERGRRHRRRQPKRCRRSPMPQRAKLAEWWDVQPVVTVPVPTDGAKVLIVKFSDYQCRRMRATHRRLQAGVREVCRQQAVPLHREALPARRRSATTGRRAAITSRRARRRPAC